jgi:hypothetical protein
MRWLTRTVPSCWRAAAGCLALALVAAAQPLTPARAASIEAQFRGCDAAGWCRFWIESPPAAIQPLQRVRPRGVAQPAASAEVASAVRDRLNALLASMIHQHKRIELHDLRAQDDGIATATITVNGADIASDPALRELLGDPSR